MRTQLTSVTTLLLCLTFAATSASAAATYDVNGSVKPNTTPEFPPGTPLGGDQFKSGSLSGFIGIQDNPGGSSGFALDDFSVTFEGTTINDETVKVVFSSPNGGNATNAIWEAGGSLTNDGRFEIIDNLSSSNEFYRLAVTYPGLNSTGFDGNGDEISVGLNGFFSARENDFDGDFIASTEVQGTVTFNQGEATAVPVPGVLPMLGTGLALLGFVGLRRRIAGD